ncbi:4'-phosphopantetheinyl transferase family protein [Desmospora profundinema]|uniref:Phosphopantetheinyl transferase n=1 Tax=Desmospora profundinema TaxID=1571184 RepID=A0ABU1IS55_9BACL|nr:hypothetical protein [Desmospora profundinema]MDR6226585.1 phosphopantetheinyl transferase [Desmospora profundinema]
MVNRIYPIRFVPPSNHNDHPLLALAPIHSFENGRIEQWFTHREWNQFRIKNILALQRMVARIVTKQALLDMKKGWRPKDLEIMNEPSGIPYVLERDETRFQGISLSHTDRVAVGAVHRLGRVGTDIEEVKVRHPVFHQWVLQQIPLKIAKDFTDLVCDERLQVTMWWTVKEAIAKYCGTGFKDLRSSPVTKWIPTYIAPFDPGKSWFGSDVREAYGFFKISGDRMLYTWLIVGSKRCACMVWDNSFIGGTNESFGR